MDIVSLLCREGNFCFIFQGKSSYTRPPLLPTGTYELYDSCVDNLSDPKMYIVFEIDQCYPKYLIKYELDEYEPGKLMRLQRYSNIRS